ncbi:MAG: protein kinase [Acidobacteriota bacterium]
MPLVPGSQIGPYEIIELIGKGGMGEVYRAHDPRLRRDVAIKTSAQRFGERFEREARAVAALNHPNICQVYDVGPDYLVMELIEGPTLSELIKQGALPLDEAIRISEQIAEALAAAHEKLITHRDLKPGNVKVKEDGTVKVLDFGLAKIGGTPTTSASDNSPTLSMSLTQAGVILGTAAYMSPEQARGKPVDARSDIWAFGVVLFEMLTARRLFRGEDLTETLASVVKEQPNLSAVPARMRPLIEACLQKDPKKRLQSIGDRHLLTAQVQTPRSSQTRWLWPALMGAMTLLAGGLAWIHFREVQPEVQTLRYVLTRPNNAPFAYVQISPNGRYIAYSSRTGNTRLHLRALDSLEERDLPGTEGASYPFFSPDSERIGFFSQGKMKAMAVGGGPATVIADAPDPRGGTWGPDGVIVFAPTVNGGLSRVSVSGGPPAELNLAHEGAGDSLRYPAFLPDSDRFLYLAQRENLEDVGIFVASLDGKPGSRIVPDRSSAIFVPGTRSKTQGHILFRRDTTLMAQPFDMDRLQTRGEAFPLADQIPDNGNVGYAAFSAAPNGTLVFTSGGGSPEEREIVWLDRSGKRGKSVVKQKNIASFSLAPNGAQVVYSTGNFSGIGLNIPGDLWLHDVAHGASQRFSYGPANPITPSWSPDGGSIVYSNTIGNGILNELVQKTTQTSAKEESLGITGTNAYLTGWSSDGKTMVYTVTGDKTKDDLWLLPLNGDRKPKMVKQTPYSETSGQLSPDGRWITYTSDASGSNEIYLQALDGGGVQRQISVGGGRNATWRSDGKEVYFLAIASAGPKIMAVDVQPGPNLTFGTPRELFTEPALLLPGRTQAIYPNAAGTQFLLLLRTGTAPSFPPLTVVTNWQKAYGK